MFCTKCGQANRDGARFCHKCGAELAQRAAAVPDIPTPPPKPEPAPEAVPAAAPVPATAAATHPPAAASHASTASHPGDDSAASTSLPPPSNSNSRNAIVLSSVVLVCVLAAAATWMLTRDKAPTAVAPVAEENAPPQLAAAPAPPPEPTATTPVAAPESLPPAPGMAVKPVSEKPVFLSETEVKRLVARLQQEPAPSSCQAAALKIRKDNNTGPTQASDIAKRAYPDLCGTTSAAPVAAAPLNPDNKTIDQLYEERAAAECAKGLNGLLCREILHNKLCNGRWSANPPPGQSRCHRADTGDSY